MSQIVTRKGPVGEDKEKGQTSDTPVKEMKKKMAANAEKEKQAAEKHAEKDKEKEKEKLAETKQSEKAEKNVEKNSEKKEKPEKASEKKEKQAEKEKVDKSVDKNADKKTEAPAEKAKEDKNAKPERADDKVTRESKERETPKPKVNGARTNGQRANANANGDAGDSDGTVSSDEELVIIDHERDDMFPELAYDDSDGEFEPPTPEGLPSRSYTRRSQAKAARTPETPRPSRDPPDDSKESKVLKLKEDTPVTDRKLRSSDSPKPETRKTEKTEKTEKKDKEADSAGKKDLEVAEGRDEHGKDKSATELGGDVDMDEGAEGAERAARGSKDKDGTNYSRSRVKVSPYRRLADQTVSSVTANYTGNNTTMEMDLSEASLAEEAAPADGSPYLSGLRAIRGRRSYKPLKEMALRNVGVSRSVRSATGVGGSEQPSRPTAPVVGRKRKPEGDDYAEPAEEAREEGEARDGGRGKRARLLDRLVRPFRGAASTPLPPRRNAEIVGINTDLPLTAPVASPDTFDPETLKAATVPPPAAPPAPSAPAPVGLRDRDSKRCTVM